MRSPSPVVGPFDLRALLDRVAVKGGNPCAGAS